MLLVYSNSQQEYSAAVGETLSVIIINMGEDNVNKLLCCASCGIAELDEIKLKECDDCDLVKSTKS